MRKIIALLLIAFLVVNTTGCDSLRKKFTRKKKEGVKKPRIYQVKKYEKKPTPELYQKHFAYWVSWQSEIIQELGQNHKKDVRCIEEIVGQVKDMQGILVPEKAAELQKHIDKLEQVGDLIEREDMTQANKYSILQTLEHEDRVIKREFCLKKVKPYLRKSFDEESAPVASEGTMTKN